MMMMINIGSHVSAADEVFSTFGCTMATIEQLSIQPAIFSMQLCTQNVQFKTDLCSF